MAGREKLGTRVMSLLIFAGFLLVPLQSPSQNTLAIESFNSSNGSLNNANGGSGWAAPWQVQNGNMDVPGYDVANAKPLTYAGVATSGPYAIGGDAWLTAGRFLDTSAGGPFASYLTNNLIGAPGTTLLFGVLLRKDIDTDDPMSITLHAGSPPVWVNVPGIAVGHFGGASDTGGIRYWSLSLAGVVYQSHTPVVVGQPAFLVLEISFGGTSTVNFYVNPPADALPSTPDVQAATSKSIAFQSIAFYGGAGTNQSSVDEIRLAATYGSLVSGAAAPPDAPGAISATPGNQTVSLSWTPVAGASQYLIYQMVSGVPQLDATLSAASFSDSGLANNTPYTFYVVASGPSGSSAPSARVTAIPRAPAPAAHPALGANLAGVADFARQWPFVDAFKTARPWIAQQAGSAWGQGPPLSVDSHGWITSLQPNQYAETIMFDNANRDDAADYPVGQYTLLYDGSGTISFDLQSATIVSQTPGRMVVNVPAGLNGIFLIESATNPSNPIRNIRFILPGFESTYRTQPFHPLFLQRLENYQVLRFMEWMLTNGSTVQSWSQRATPDDYTYSWRGVPLEVMIQLANTLQVKPWFNIPAEANTSYAQQFARLIQSNLSPSLAFYLEYSNETWNTSFPQSAYIEAQGQALAFSADPTIAGADYTAYRAVQIFNAFQAIVGTGRMIRVIASEAGNSWLSNQTLQFQNAFNSADVLAIAPYFNCSDAATGGFGVLGDPSTADQVAAMSISQVEAIQLAHINACVLQEMQSNSAVAASYGLKMVAYEGGQSLVGYGGAENNDAMTALFGAVNRDSGMGPLYNQYFQNWIKSGGDLFVHYSDTAAYTQYGNFGTLEYQDQDPGTSPKHEALMSFASQHP